jgi:type II secretory pathway pseudopilin PulG
MHSPKRQFLTTQRGVSISGLIAVMVILGLIAVVAMKVLPSISEYRAIKETIAMVKTAGGSVREMQIAFDKNAQIQDISTISSKDLIIAKEDGETEISFAYEKRIPLGGPVSLLIDYAGTTSKTGVVAKPAEPAK